MTKLKLPSILLFCILNMFPGANHLQSSYLVESGLSMQVGEELTYEVSYSLLKLGTVVLKVKDRKTFNGRTYYLTEAYIDSYPGIPFVDLHQIYQSHVNSNQYSDYFRGLVQYEDYTSYTEYNFNYQKKVLGIKKGRVYPPQVWTDSTTTAEKNYQDGLSIFYFARMNFGKSRSVNIPCFVNEAKVLTKINYYTDTTDISIDAVDYDVSCLYLNGETDFVSVFGLTGHFEGWFSNDEASIPILAKMKVIIGDITLELKKWKRAGWQPPKYTEKKN